LKKLQNAIYGTAGALMLAGSFGVLCASAFAQTQTTTPPPASSSSSSTTKKPDAAKPVTTANTTGAAKTSSAPASTTSHSSARSQGTSATRTTAANHSSSTSGHGTTTSAKKKTTAAKSTRVKMQTAPTSDRIMEIQSALAKAGAYDGDPTGNWDAKTVAAMTKFQQSNGLTPSGKLDALSLQKLGLGSDTAGKGAPRPATPSTTAASSSSSGIRR
jgi:cytoskeletal protein RodZ